MGIEIKCYLKVQRIKVKKIDIIKFHFKRVIFDSMIISLISGIILLYKKGLATLLAVSVSTVIGDIIFIIVLCFTLVTLKKDKSNLLEQTGWSQENILKFKIYIDILFFITSILIFFIFDIEALYEIFLSVFIPLVICNLYKNRI
jgi:hypothetical protein